MENKYYSPNIQEFHVGFECEVYNGKGFYQSCKIDDKESNNWKAKTFKGDFLEIEELRGLCNLRVKYLDKKDIESLGFEQARMKSVNKAGNFYTNKELNLMLFHSSEDCTLSLQTLDSSKSEIFAKTGEDLNRVSRIKLKNKSEFIKFLSQLE